MAYGKIKIDTIESSTKTVLVDDIPIPADAAPQPLGVAAIGASTDYAREDHVHAMPSAADVGADPSGTAASAISTHEAAADPHPGYALESSLGTSAVLDVGTTAGTVAAGDRGLLTGGTTGQALVKASNTDYDTQWADVTAVAALDDLTDVTLTSPSDGQVLEYDSATSTWVNATPSGGGGTPGGSDTQVQYNNAGSFGGSADLTWDDTAKELIVAGKTVTASVTVQKSAVAEIETLTDAATITPDLSTSCNYTVTLGGNRTLANPTNIVAGQSGSIFIVQDGTGGRTLAWGSYWDFAGGTAPTLSTGIGAVDRVDYIVRSSTSIHAVFTGNYS